MNRASPQQEFEVQRSVFYERHKQVLDRLAVAFEQLRAGRRAQAMRDRAHKSPVGRLR